MSDANALNIPSIGPISNTATGTFSSAYNKFYQPGFANIGMAFSGSTFTVQSEGGTAFSTTNPGFIALESLANPGQIKRYSVTANQTFTQAGLGNNLFGVTTAVDITVDVPFFLYAVSNANNGENTIAFMISRYPNAAISPIAGSIGQSGNTLASTQGSFFSLATITAADYASSPCQCIGSFRMRYASSLWTVQTLLISDGAGQFQQNVIFSFPISQFGAASGKYFKDNGGTAPAFSQNGYSYSLDRSNKQYFTYGFTTATTAGVGAVDAILAMPFKGGSGGIGTAFWFNNGSATYSVSLADNTTTNTLKFRYTNPTTSNILQNSQIQLNDNIGGFAYSYIEYL